MRGEYAILTTFSCLTGVTDSVYATSMDIRPTHQSENASNDAGSHICAQSLASSCEERVINRLAEILFEQCLQQMRTGTHVRKRNKQRTT